MRILPSVGSVMRLSIFSRVLLPAPLRPTIPTTSPWSMLKDTSRSAQKSVSRRFSVARRFIHAKGARTAASIAWRIPSLEDARWRPSAYRFPSPSMTMASFGFWVLLDMLIINSQITSAKVRSVLRKYQIPEINISVAEAEAIVNSAQ